MKFIYTVFSLFFILTSVAFIYPNIRDTGDARRSDLGGLREYNISIEEAYLRGILRGGETDFSSKAVTADIDNAAAPESCDNSTDSSVSEIVDALETVAKVVEDVSGDFATDKMSVFPMEINSYVEKYVEYFLTTKISFLKRSLKNAEPYIKEMKSIFIENGLPEELAYLPLIESGFVNHAQSRAKAVGMWQFIPDTGRWLGMQMNIWLDERRDPIVSAGYAARYLKFLYEKFDDWYLALAAYNHGGFNVKKGLKKIKTRDFYDLVKYKAIPAETQSYVPSFVAGLYIIKNINAYDIDYKEEDGDFRYYKLPFMAPANLVAKYSGVDYATFIKYNPSLISGFVPEEKYNYLIRLPKDNIDKLEANVEVLRNSVSASYIPYFVKEGDALSKIAEAFNAPISLIMSINKIKNSNFLRVGQKIFIPVVKKIKS
ncbi:MAG TPA: transglycosylase SLT domain-containing protein [Spirochaetota bacterium]|jgi:membrane-bound lytic murein transglycosylase D|nr:MAG: Membrane-bound lytic murein transglycosylase D precursor [Spirochaetes bacterium ADurb.Bin133]HNZ25890.1 transglycosylase SLT domain-containing protein [Spirochaetota bacterium]HPY87679.1 transglycosylase SLT domain-containing protein [Spirochaetota bacterium]HQB60159.1 transglycosylase SLT domain-containing protein [Spirochaetota bacterium]